MRTSCWSSLEVARRIGNHEFVMRSYYNLVEGMWRLGDYTKVGHVPRRRERLQP